MQNLKKPESMTGHAFGVNVSQFEITSDLLRNLYKFDLTPITKLVLLELTTHLNESKNGSVVFPSINYIAEVLGIGLTAAKKAINDLIQAGLIIKSKRDNVKGNYNKYLLRHDKINFNEVKNENRYIYTPEDINSQKTANKQPKNEFFKRSENDLSMIRTNNIEQINNKEEDILRKYAIKHGAKNVNAYEDVLKKNGSAEKIISEYKEKQRVKKIGEIEEKKTRELLNRYASYEEFSSPPSDTWREFGEKIGYKK